MTDKELAVFGERLYEAVLLTPLPAGTILGLATAIRYNLPWSELPRTLRFAVFKIAAASTGEPMDAPESGAGAEQPAPSPAQDPPGNAGSEPPGQSGLSVAEGRDTDGDDPESERPVMAAPGEIGTQVRGA
jgi:hypothetical protein